MHRFLKRPATTVVMALLFAVGASAANQPNVILINMDNFGYGELGSYGGGITRGGATPRLDLLAREGLRLTNFNVEAQCTPSRAALMTGRYAVRTGNATVPLDVEAYGLVQWEYTMAEMFADQGYATAAFGKWHLGHTPGRFPTDQGFDEWYGIPNSTDEAYWPSNSRYKDGVHPFVRYEYIMQGRKGGEPEKVKVYDLDARRTIDGELTDRALDFIERQHQAKVPFFLYLPYTQTHLPVLPAAEFDGITGNGMWGDILTQIDAYTGRILDKVDELGLADDTIFIFTSDNGPEGKAPFEGSAGPWRGVYFTGLEGSLRVPFIIRWPGHIPADRVSDEIVHQVDLYTTLAAVIGGSVPSDRMIDGVDQLAFFAGSSAKSSRESVMIYVGEQLFGIKWHNWKGMFKEVDSGRAPLKIYATPVIYDLYTDPREMHPERQLLENTWVRYPMNQILREHMISLKKEAPVPKGAPDPYTPNR